MAKTLGETKLFMSAHGIGNALKPLKPRIKKVLGRKANEFKKDLNTKVSDLLSKDGGKARRLKDFKSSQDDDNEGADYSSLRKRFKNLSDDDQDGIRDNLAKNPDWTGGSATDSKTTQKFKTPEEAEEVEENNVQNREIYKDEVSKAEEKNFVEKDAESVAENEGKTLADTAQSAAQSLSDKVGELANKAGNFVKSGAQRISDTVNGLNKTAGTVADDAEAEVSKVAEKKASKAVAKQMAEKTIAKDGEAVVEDTVGEVAGAALDAVPLADIGGAILGGVIAIKKAIQVRKLEKEDEGLKPTIQVAGSTQQIGV